MKRRNKYFAKKTQVGKYLFDSKAEADMYLELKKWRKAGRITGLKLQPEFELLPRIILANGRTQRPVTYTADFEFYDAERGVRRVIDCKGFKTEVYKLKKKMFNAKFMDEKLVLEETI